MVISALNPVHSVLWLIVAFTSASALFILLEVEFIALIFLIVYVGAIAILFLFVIMMLNLTDLGHKGDWRESGGDMSNYLPTGFIIGVVFLFEILIFQIRMNESMGNLWIRSQSDRIGNDSSEIGNIPYLYNWAPWAGAEGYSVKASNIEVLGRVLYTNYYYLFILASFILLVAMIGAIVLTHDTRIQIKRQDIFIQTSRSLWDRMGNREST